MSDARTFDTGATRDTDTRKHDLEGFLSPLAIREYGRYMHQHRTQTDGIIRDSDNWQKGFPVDTLMKSMFRHFIDLWTLHRGYEAVDFDNQPVGILDALCGILFNAQAYLHELLKEEHGIAKAFAERDAIADADCQGSELPDEEFDAVDAGYYASKPVVDDTQAREEFAARMAAAIARAEQKHQIVTPDSDGKGYTIVPDADGVEAFAAKMAPLDQNEIRMINDHIEDQRIRRQQEAAPYHDHDYKEACIPGVCCAAPGEAFETYNTGQLPTQ